jgi:hypothetical protein
MTTARKHEEGVVPSAAGISERLVVKFSLATVGLFSLAMYTYLREPAWLFHRKDFQTGNEIVRRVEAFRLARKRLPRYAGRSRVRGSKSRCLLSEN